MEILLTPFVCSSAYPFTVKRVRSALCKGMSLLVFGVNTRLFVCANRLSILYMVIKLRDECEKLISTAKGHTLFISHFR